MGSSERENTRRQRPSPEDFAEHRAYLRAMISYLKETQPQFSYRFFARRAGFSSPNFLKLVADGRRNLSSDSVPKFARGLGLDARETASFADLVALGHAANDDDRNRALARLHRARDTSRTRRLEAEQFEVFSQWYVLPIRELMLDPEFEDDPQWIARTMRPRIKVSEARRALDLLLSTGLAVRGEDGRLKPADTKITTGPQVRSLGVRNFHRAMLGIAAESLDQIPPDERDITGLTLTLSKEQYQQVRGRLEAFRREILDLVEDETARVGPQRVYHAGFLLFPVTRRTNS